MYPGTVYRKVDGVYSFLSTGTTRDIDIFVLLSFFLLSDAVKVFKILATVSPEGTGSTGVSSPSFT